MARLLIIPDVHGRTFWKDAISKHGDECDKIIFLGDYLDPYQMYEDITRKQSMEILNEIIEYKRNNKDKVILLLGNHDIQYISKRFFIRARYDSSNAWKNERTFRENLSLFQLTYECENDGKRILFSHAGLMNSFVERNKDYIGEPTSENLNKLLFTEKGIDILNDISYHRTWASYAQDTGSIVWSDLNEKLDNPADAIVEMYDYQIFGHTIQDEGYPVIIRQWACLDCQRAFILKENNELEKIH